MSKSYLIIDTPKNCDYCPVGNDGPWCPLVPEGADVEDQNDHSKRPDWCPLKRDYDVIDENRSLRFDLACNWAWRGTFDKELMLFQDELFNLQDELKNEICRNTELEHSLGACLDTVMSLIDEIIEYGNS